ncbi:MAG: cobalt-precorrin-6A reductase [Paracoccaceae bacterium]
MIVNQGASPIAHNLLVLGGTTEATALCQRLAEDGITGTVSFAGRVKRPVRQPLPQRVGGFGGVEGLVDFLRVEGISHVIDATHPFAAQMSTNAIGACAQVNIPLMALTRTPWHTQSGDQWTNVPDIAAAVQALKGTPKRVMLAVGRMHLAEFAPNSQHFYLLRLVDPPAVDLPFPRHAVVVERGPFSIDADLDLMKAHDIDLVVSKNSGGVGAYAKIAAARTLGLPVVMIDRPSIPKRLEAHSVEAVMDWLPHALTDRGV